MDNKVAEALLGVDERSKQKELDREEELRQLRIQSEAAWSQSDMSRPQSQQQDVGFIISFAHKCWSTTEVDQHLWNLLHGVEDNPNHTSALGGAPYYPPTLASVESSSARGRGNQAGDNLLSSLAAARAKLMGRWTKIFMITGYYKNRYLFCFLMSL